MATGPNNKLSADANKRREALTNASAYHSSELYTLAKIEDEDWYVGMVPASEVVSFLEQPGDFAVRASDARDFCELILSVRGDGVALHATLICDKKEKMWTLKLRKSERKLFKSISSLIDHYKKNPLPFPAPNNKITLKQPCKRPKWILKRSNIERGALLGSGNFCNVYRGVLNKRRTVAIKSCLPVEAEEKKAEEQAEQKFLARESLIREGHLMLCIRHINIIRFYGIIFDKPPVLIVMEYCSGGALLDHLTKFGNRITVGELIKYSNDAAEGMTHLHQSGLIHRDLAARNCLISKYGLIKIADFGLSKIASEVAPEHTQFKMQVPLRWMAPETLHRNQLYSEKSDIWSFGVLLFEIFSQGSKPWTSWENKKIATYIRRAQMPPFPDTAPKEIAALARDSIWKLDPAKRPKFTQVLEILKKAQLTYPYPNLEKLTLNEIEGVHAVKPELVLELEENETEDIGKEALLVAIDRAEAKARMTTQSREISCDEPIIQDSAPKKDDLSPANFKAYQTNGRGQK